MSETIISKKEYTALRKTRNNLKDQFNSSGDFREIKILKRKIKEIDKTLEICKLPTHPCQKNGKKDNENTDKNTNEQ